MSFGFVYIVLVGRTWDRWHCQPALPLGGFYQCGKRKSEASLKSREAAAMRSGGLYSLSLQTFSRTNCIVSATPKSQEGNWWAAAQWGGWAVPWSALLYLPSRGGQKNGRKTFLTWNTGNKQISSMSSACVPLRTKIHSVLILLGTSHAKMQF